MKFRDLAIGQKFYLVSDEKQTVYEKADDFKGFSVHGWVYSIDVELDALCVPVE